MLEKLGGTEEQRRGFLSTESLPYIENIHNAREEVAAFSRAYRRIVEDAGLLDDGGLVVVI